MTIKFAAMYFIPSIMTKRSVLSDSFKQALRRLTEMNEKAILLELEKLLCLRLDGNSGVHVIWIKRVFVSEWHEFFIAYSRSIDLGVVFKTRKGWPF